LGPEPNATPPDAARRALPGGGYAEQYRVEPDPARLIGYGISFGQAAAAVEAKNASCGANYIEHNGEGYVVRTSGRVERLAEIAEIAVTTRNGVPVRLWMTELQPRGWRALTACATPLPGRCGLPPS